MRDKDFDYIVTPYEEKLARIIPLPYPIVWLLFSCLLLGLHLFALWRTGEPFKPLWPIVVVGLLPGLISIGTIWFSKILEQFTPSLYLFIDWPEEQVREWYESEVRAIFNLKWMLGCGVPTAILMLLCVVIGPLWPTNAYPKITFSILIFALGFLAGGMIYTMIRIPIIVYRLGKIEEIKVSVYQHPLTSVKAVGRLLGKISLVIIGIYVFGISYHLFCEANTLTVLVTCFFGLFVLAFFILPQFNVHKIMSKVKHRRLRRFSVYLEESLQNVTKDPSRKNVQRVRELFDVQKSLNMMGEWPFDTKILLVILIGIVMPIIVVLLQVLWKRS